MKRKILIGFILLMLVFSFVFGLTSCDTSPTNSSTSSSTKETISYTITFKDYDGTVLQTSKVKEGDIPTYNNSNPTRESDENYSYTFSGWTPTITAVSGDIVYTATYSKKELVDVYYTITFKDYDGTVLQTSKVKEGDIPTYNNSNPTRESDENYSYTFNSWTPTLTAVSDDIVYTATYTQKDLLYNVTIDLDGGSSNTKLQFKTDEMSKDLLPFVVEKENYVFRGYSLNDIKVYNEKGEPVNNYELSSNMTFKAIFEDTVKLDIFYTLYNPRTNELVETYNTKPVDICDISESNSYNCNTKADLFVTLNEGYKFVGWYNENNELLSEFKNFSYFVYTKDIKIEARFEYSFYQFTIWSNNTDLGQVKRESLYGVSYFNSHVSLEYYTGSVTIVANSKSSTRFLGWYNENNELVSTNETYTFDMINRDYKLEAKWNYFTITYDSNGGTNNSSNLESYNIDTKNITLLAPTRIGYTFNGWEYKGNIINEIATSNICHMSIKALWTANTNTLYKVEHYQENISDSNFTLYETDSLEGTTDTKTSGCVKTYSGFTSPTITQVNIDGDGSTVIKLYYTRNTYKVTLTKNNDKAGSVSCTESTSGSGGSYKYKKDITIEATTNTGYEFIGWYNSDTLYTKELSVTYDVEDKDVIFEARYSPLKYTIIIDNKCENVEISGITSGDKYEYNSQINLIATNNSGSYIKWSVNGVIKNRGDKYIFEVPANDITITITTTDIKPIYIRENNKIYFGRYPQTKVIDNTLITELNSKAGTKPTANNSYSWTSYYYYIKGTISNYMFYQDIDYDNDGQYDYRGVYFTQYRPSSTTFSSSKDSSYQANNKYYTNTIYWFSYDQIEWNILAEEDGEALIIANLILDSQEYYPVSSSYKFNHNGYNGYANNYELSEIRKFLNDDFYNNAFNNLEKELIKTTTVDNSASSTGQTSNEYACSYTSDKIFLLSYEEATTYFTSNDARKAKGSDYAKCQGLHASNIKSNYDDWWLRSPSNYVIDMDYAKYAYDVKGEGNIGRHDVPYTNNGVRPACWIVL